MEDKKEKIQKLLNLATSDNEHEAALANAKATELMNKWNLVYYFILLLSQSYLNKKVFR